MNHNEVRFGNWVKSGDHFFKIKGVNPDWAIFLHKGDDWCTDWMLVEPIPLTPEILEKAGFVAEPNKLDVFSRKRLRIWFNGRGAALCYLIEEDTTTGHYIPIQIRYLHQLQNLVHALTGEELEINL